MNWAKYVTLSILVFFLLGGILGCDPEQTGHRPVHPANLLMNAVQGGTGTLHAVLVADTNASDIRASVEADLDTMSTFVERVAEQTGLSLNKQVISDDVVTLHAVEMAVKDVPAGPGDVVIFYYAGHGGQPVERKTRWPRMYFSSDNSGEGMDVNAIFVVFSRKNPNFLLVLIDPRNDLAPHIVPPEETTQLPVIDDGRPDAYRQLFVVNRGRIIAAGTRPDEDGLGSVWGGCFTQQFLQTLYQSLTLEEPPTWKTIMDQATSPLGTSQHPQYLIY